MNAWASWAVLVAVFATTIALTALLVRIDLIVTDALERRRNRRQRVRGFDEAYRYALARDAVARAQKPHTRIGHHDTNGSNTND